MARAEVGARDLHVSVVALVRNFDGDPLAADAIVAPRAREVQRSRREVVGRHDVVVDRRRVRVGEDRSVAVAALGRHLGDVVLGFEVETQNLHPIVCVDSSSNLCTKDVAAAASRQCRGGGAASRRRRGGATAPPVAPRRPTMFAPRTRVRHERPGSTSESWRRSNPPRCPVDPPSPYTTPVGTRTHRRASSRRPRRPASSRRDRRCRPRSSRLHQRGRRWRDLSQQLFPWRARKESLVRSYLRPRPRRGPRRSATFRLSVLVLSAARKTRSPRLLHATLARTGCKSHGSHDGSALRYCLSPAGRLKIEPR